MNKLILFLLFVSNLTFAQSTVEIKNFIHMLVNVDQKEFPGSKGQYLVWEYDMINNTAETITVIALPLKAYNDPFFDKYMLHNSTDVVYEYDLKHFSSGTAVKETSTSNGPVESGSFSNQLQLRERYIKQIPPGGKLKFGSSKKVEKTTGDSTSISIQFTYNTETIDRAAASQMLDKINEELEAKRKPFAEVLITSHDIYNYGRDCAKARLDEKGEFCDAVKEYQNLKGNRRKQLNHLKMLLKVTPLKVTSELYQKTVENKR